MERQLSGKSFRKLWTTSRGSPLFYEGRLWTKCSTRRFVMAFHRFRTPLLLVESLFSEFDSSNCQFGSPFSEVDSSLREFVSSSCQFDHRQPKFASLESV